MFKWMIILCFLLTANLSAEKKVLAFAGSTREESFNNKLILEAAEAAKQMGASVTVINLKDFPMPFYDADLEAKEKLPPKAQQLRQLMINSDLIFIASPEYNGSLSGVLKNSIDWASRNEDGGPSREAFKGKTFLIMSTSPGSTGGGRGLVHLRAIIEDIGGTVIPMQITVPDAHKAFNEKGQLRDPALRTTLEDNVKSALNS